MRTNRTALVSLIILGGFLVGLAILVIGMGTSTGVAMGGTSSVMAVAEEEKPAYAQGGWIKNNAPWPIQITSVDVDYVGASAAPALYLSENQSLTPPPEGEDPAWTAAPASLPYTVAPGSVWYFGFALSPDPLRVASFDSITVKGHGLLGFGFEQTHTGVAVAASSSALPFPMAAEDPARQAESFTRMLDLTVLVLDRDSVEQVQILMGADSTPDDAAALQLSQASYVPEMTYAVREESEDGRTQVIAFYLTDPEVDALPALRFDWANYRWTLSLADEPATE